MTSGTTLAKTMRVWGEEVPDWVRVLAEACDQSSLRAVAVRLELSPAALSLALNRKRNKLDFVKARVEARLPARMVACPVRGNLDRNECLREQAKPFSSANPLRVQLYRACRSGCAHYEPRSKA